MSKRLLCSPDPLKFDGFVVLQYKKASNEDPKK